MQFVGCLGLRAQLFDGIPGIVHIANAIIRGEFREDLGLEITDVHRVVKPRRYLITPAAARPRDRSSVVTRPRIPPP